MLSIKCLRSNKNDRLFYVLVYSDPRVVDSKDVFLTFDILTIARVWGKSARDVYLLEEGDVINIL